MTVITAWEAIDKALTKLEEADNKPKRIQRKRVKGWRMPENTVYVGRPSKWGNPFTVIACKSVKNKGLFFVNDGGPYNTKTKQAAHQVAADRYFQYICRRVDLDIDELRGKNLACWCPLDQPCHADVLLELANK